MKLLSHWTVQNQVCRVLLLNEQNHWPRQLTMQQTLLTTLYKSHLSAAVFSPVLGLPQAKPVPRLEDEPILPPLLTSLYDSKYIDLNDNELAEVVQCRINDIQLTKEAAFLEKSPKQQSSSTLWYDHQQGRITASLFGRVVQCTENTYSIQHHWLKTSCSSVNPSIPALKWG